MNLPLAEKVALVTGGARDIGRAVSLRLAELGASVAVNYFDNPEQAKETVLTIVGGGGKAVAIQGDVTIPSSVDRLVAKAREVIEQALAR